VPDSSEKGYDINAIEPIRQYSMYEDMKDYLCGKRSTLSLLTAKRAVWEEGKGWKCPQNLHPCTNGGRDQGKPICAEADSP
jgi:hypothetical protein